MGAQQVLRAARGLVGAIAALAAAPARADVPAPAAAVAAGEPVIVVDLRPGAPADLTASRHALGDALAGAQGVAVVEDATLERALSGFAVDKDAIRLGQALDAARAAFGALDCAGATAAADRAIDDLAARQAAGLDDGPALRSAYAYQVLCADQAGDALTVARAAARLRALGVRTGDDAGISAATWAKLPEIDASSGEIVAVTITADQPDAEVWVDHAAAGASPATVYLPAGEHVLAAAVGKGGPRGATRVEVHGKTFAVTLPLADPRGTWSELAGFVHAWRDGVSPPTNAGLTSIMAAAHTRFAIVLAGARTAEVWGKAPGEPVARKLDTASLDQPMEIAAIVVDRVAAWDGHAPDPDQPLLTETPEERAARYGGGKPDRTKWYVYASIAGAILVGSAVIYFNDAANDTQRIVIQGP